MESKLSAILEQIQAQISDKNIKLNEFLEKNNLKDESLQTLFNSSISFSPIFVKCKTVETIMRRRELSNEEITGTYKFIKESIYSSKENKKDLMILFCLLELISSKIVIKDEIVEICFKFSHKIFLKHYILNILNLTEMKILQRYRDKSVLFKHFLDSKIENKGTAINVLCNLFKNFNLENMPRESFLIFITTSPTFYINLFPKNYNNTGMRNLKKLIKVLPKNKASDLNLLLENESSEKLFLSGGNDIDFSFNFCDEVRIEYLKYIKDICKLIKFIKINQFYSDAGLRILYIRYFNNFFVEYKKKIRKRKCNVDAEILADDAYLIELKSIVLKMCESPVKIRRELGVNFLSSLIDQNIIANEKNEVAILEKLIYDSYSEIREIAIKHIKTDTLKYEYILEKITSYEYHKIYSGIEILKKSANKNEILPKILDFFKHQVDKIKSEDMKEILKYPIFGTIYFCSTFGLEVDNEINFLRLNFLNYMKKNSSNYVTDLNENYYNVDKSYDIIVWRSLKEIASYLSKNIHNLIDLDPLVDIVFNIKHLGLSSYINEIIESKLKVMNINTEEIKIYIKILLDRTMEERKLSLTRKGSGLPKLFTTFLFNNNDRQTISIFIVDELLMRLNKCNNIDVLVLYIQILASFCEDSRCKEILKHKLNEITKSAIKHIESNEWRLRSAGVVLFSKIILIIFGKNGCNRNYKKHMNGISQFREMLIDQLKSTDNKTLKMIGLTIHDRILNLNKAEIDFINECTRMSELIKLKANKILIERKIKTDNYYKCKETNLESYNDHRQMKYEDRMIFYFHKLHDEEKYVRDFVCEDIIQYKFIKASAEYNKFAIVRDAHKKGYLDRLSKTVKKNEDFIESKFSCFSKEEKSEIFDYEYNKEIFENFGIL